MEPLPKLELDDILSKPGTLRRTSSCGSMISDSISLGAEARHGVLIEISGRSISGVIWIGRRMRLKVPKITTRIPATMTATGFPRDIRVRVKSASLFAHGHLFQNQASDQTAKRSARIRLGRCTTARFYQAGAWNSKALATKLVSLISGLPSNMLPALPAGQRCNNHGPDNGVPRKAPHETEKPALISAETWHF
jgi:hypothetical protein